ncbi:MAG: hypothetical protein UZ11_BCD004000303 [Bacteroidetes bacterium OLB11]|nr:MAG: hypothetical protein UZ11_BCD004000303 [Bacteroidetes bacterium OLB11]
MQAIIEKVQSKQERAIMQAYKRHKISDNEYRKLMNEQIAIKRYINAANADRYWSPAEINRVEGKLDRASQRMKRYKTNWEY